MEKDKLVRVNVAAKKLGVSRDTIYRLIRDGKLDCIRPTPHTTHIKMSSLEQVSKNPFLY